MTYFLHNITSCQNTLKMKEDRKIKIRSFEYQCNIDEILNDTNLYHLDKNCCIYIHITVLISYRISMRQPLQSDAISDTS